MGESEKERPSLPFYFFIFHFKHERFEAKENVSLFALAVNVKNGKKKTKEEELSISKSSLSRRKEHCPKDVFPSLHHSLRELR